MPFISLFTFDDIPNITNVVKCLNGKKSDDFWIKASPSKYNREEVFIQYWYYENIEQSLRQFLEDDAYEIVSFLNKSGKNKVLKRIYCFINFKTKTLEIYRGPDKKMRKVLNVLSKYLKVKFKPLIIKPHEIERILNHAEEINVAVFHNVHSLKLEIMKGHKLQENLKFKHHMRYFRNCLRAISFKPKIKFLNNSKYKVYLDGDKGIIGFSRNEVFKWRPRFEIRQIVQIIASCNGLLK